MMEWMHECVRQCGHGVRNARCFSHRAIPPPEGGAWRCQGGGSSYLRMVLSKVERASLWKVMMMLVGGRSAQ